MDYRSRVKTVEVAELLEFVDSDPLLKELKERIRRINLKYTGKRMSTRIHETAEIVSEVWTGDYQLNKHKPSDLHTQLLYAYSELLYEAIVKEDKKTITYAEAYDFCYICAEDALKG